MRKSIRGLWRGSLACLAAVALAAGLSGCQHLASGEADKSLLADPSHEKPITVWFDATANWSRLGNREEIGAMMDKCVEIGTDIVVIDVKPISGYVLYNSDLAPKMTEWKGETHPEDFDLLEVAIEEGHKRGLKVFASMNFFAEGHQGSEDAGVPKHGAIFDIPERQDWQAIDYVVRAGSDEPEMVPQQEGVRGYAVFMSAANPEVVEYELALLKEICQYDIDGVCLDRVRFSGITSDFSPEARTSFENFLGHEVKNWPEDVYTYELKEDAEPIDMIADEGARSGRGLSDRHERVPGPLYDRWLVWRAKTITNIIARSRALVKLEDPSIVFADYTGAWYPSYYNEGVNWASPDYDPADDYDWAPEDYHEAGYAHLMDVFYAGWYYTSLTEEDALAKGDPAWASMEGTAKLFERIIGDDTSTHASLFLQQYEGDPENFQRCARAAYDLSDGLMLFDLIYLEEYGWWDEVKEVFPERAE